jgi:hypothetical protein
MDMTDTNDAPQPWARALPCTSHTTITTSTSLRHTGSASKEHSGDEWAAVQPIILDLYITKRKSLGVVMEIMEAEHGFKATY